MVAMVFKMSQSEPYCVLAGMLPIDECSSVHEDVQTRTGSCLRIQNTFECRTDAKVEDGRYLPMFVGN